MIAAVLVRGLIGVRTEVRDALASLGLSRKHSCVLVDESRLGALRACKDVLTFGEVSDEVAALLKGRSQLAPPRGGWERKGIKKSFAEGGALGYRGRKMDDLIKRML